MEHKKIRVRIFREERREKSEEKLNFENYIEKYGYNSIINKKSVARRKYTHDILTHEYIILI